MAPQVHTCKHVESKAHLCRGPCDTTIANGKPFLLTCFWAVLSHQTLRTVQGIVLECYAWFKTPFVPPSPVGVDEAKVLTNPGLFEDAQLVDPPTLYVHQSSATNLSVADDFSESRSLLGPSPTTNAGMKILHVSPTCDLSNRIGRLSQPELQRDLYARILKLMLRLCLVSSLPLAGAGATAPSVESPGQHPSESPSPGMMPSQLCFTVLLLLIGALALWQMVISGMDAQEKRGTLIVFAMVTTWAWAGSLLMTPDAREVLMLCAFAWVIGWFCLVAVYMRLVEQRLLFLVFAVTGSGIPLPLYGISMSIKEPAWQRTAVVVKYTGGLFSILWVLGIFCGQTSAETWLRWLRRRREAAERAEMGRV
ncbi:hypothetical protein LTR15_005446 [Elasticomyces elasticus]|nr:hypothetical protein LTR15_005446 [Elasticomyces elasticus]